MEFYATCPKGFEKLLAAELASMGLSQVRTLRGQVSFAGEVQDAYRACLWSRLASRVMLVLDRIDAQDSDALYQGVSDIAWEDHIAPGSTIAIDARGTNDQLRNTQFVALRSKDAIADRLTGVRGSRPNVDTEHPDLEIVVRVGRQHATVALDLSGEPLFRRDRPARGSRRPLMAPLRPDYAAALLAAGSWYRNCRHDHPELVSLYSGTGTVLVEAASQALDRAPGLMRGRWGFEGWAGHDQGAWDDLMDEAQDRARETGDVALRLVSLDSRPGSQDATLQLLYGNGLRGCAPSFIGGRVLADAVSQLEHGPLVVADLSWVSPEDAAQEADVLGCLSVAAGAAANASGMSVLGSLPTIEKAISAQPAQQADVLVGNEPSRLLSFEPQQLGHQRPTVALKDGREVPVFVPASDQFAARLWKNARQRAKWARREDVTCYRVYDSDLPDYAVSIDLYQAATGKGRWLQVSEYHAPKQIDPTLARERLMDVLAIAPQVLDVDPADVFLRVRRHDKGGQQYADEGKLSPRGHGRDQRPGRGLRQERQQPAMAMPAGARLIDEGGLTFEVNFQSRLDCGIFLDHRLTRSMIREMAKQMRGSKRFLNLFAYTGTATCYAADGGAIHTTTVDMSRPSLDWARRNMVRNGFDSPDDEYVQADVLSWISQQRRTKNRWDLIFCDVPTFSNSSRMGQRSWDVQRDHAELLIGISRLLIEGGVCVFSCNLRNFKPDVEYLNRYGVQIEDITAQTIPEDFARNPKVHHTYLVRRTPRDQQ